MATWVNWTSDATTTTSYSGTSATIAWRAWSDTATTTSVTMGTTTAWQSWMPGEIRYIGADAASSWGVWVEKVELTAEQKAAAEAARVEADKQEAERKRRQMRINRKAEALILSLLVPSARKAWRKARIVEFRTEKRRYLVNADNGQMYILDEKGEPVERWCVHADHSFPNGDRAAAALLALQADEEAVRNRANRHTATEHDKIEVKARMRLAA